MMGQPVLDSRHPNMTPYLMVLDDGLNLRDYQLLNLPFYIFRMWQSDSLAKNRRIQLRAQSHDHTMSIVSNSRKRGE